MIVPEAMKLVGDLYYHLKLFSDKGSIPLDTEEWHDVLDGMGPTDRTNMKSKYERVLDTATRLFNNYWFRLCYSEEETPNALVENRVWLEYKKSNPEQQE
jgi:hypothetical protein